MNDLIPVGERSDGTEEVECEEIVDNVESEPS